MTTRFEQDIDEQLREMFAVHKDYFDRKEREAQGRPEWRDTLSRREVPTNREQIIGMIVEMGGE
jgi:hypothetical protein|tara:strand:+ start:547 stop:738 length:192 start_codon:yes stop_codon:yes gene_type:complete